MNVVKNMVLNKYFNCTYQPHLKNIKKKKQWKNIFYLTGYELVGTREI